METDPVGWAVTQGRMGLGYPQARRLYDEAQANGERWGLYVPDDTLPEMAAKDPKRHGALLLALRNGRRRPHGGDDQRT